MRQPHPWYSETRSGGGWFVKLSNEQHFLGKQPEGAAKPVKRNGRWNPVSEILAEYHKLMAVRDTASKSDYTLDNIIALYVEELEQENPALAKRYKQILEKLSAFVYKGKRAGKLLVNADLESIHLESWAKKYKSDQTKRTYITFCKAVMEWAVKKKTLARLCLRPMDCSGRWTNRLRLGVMDVWDVPDCRQAAWVVRPLPNGACVMSLPRSAADVLNGHTVLEVESLDRIYLKVMQSRLQTEPAIAWFFRQHRKDVFATAKVMAQMTRPFVEAIERFAESLGLPLITFERGQRKDDLMQQALAKFTGREGVLLMGKAQEKASVVRTITKRNPETGRDYPWLIKSSALVNHYYFYCVDEDFGPFFIKFCSYFPYNARLCLNGHEYAKRQLEKEGIAYEPLDNGILRCENPKRLQEICDGLNEKKIDALQRKWLKKLPHPYTARDRAAGFRYEIFMQQVEFARTQVLDKPVSGRIFFEQMLRENLDLGRPTKRQLIFDKRITRRTPSRFRTRLVTQHVVPSLWLDYKHSSIKQYFKEGRALRTELTVNNARDFGIGKALSNLPQLRQVAFAANRRLLDVQQLSHDPMLGEEEFQALTSPQEVDGQRVSGLKFGDETVLAVLTALLMFRYLPEGFRNRDLRRDTAHLLARPAHELTPGQMTYHLRRLRLRGLIERIPRTQRYRLTETGERLALFYITSLTQTIRPLASSKPREQLATAIQKTLQKHDWYGPTPKT